MLMTRDYHEALHSSGPLEPFDALFRLERFYKLFFKFSLEKSFFNFPKTHSDVHS